jgi:RNA polymerase sigma-70 factor (ECF subfamily)
MADGPLRGLALLDQPALGKTLRDYHLFHAARADLLRRAGRDFEAAAEYDSAIALSTRGPERLFLEARRARE